MMANLDYLQDLTPSQFELERRRLITEAILAMPQTSWSRLLTMQAELDALRAKDPADFNQHLWFMMSENLLNLADQLTRLKTIIEQK